MNLDAREPTRRLCAPVRRTGGTGKVQRIGQWVAQPSDFSFDLQRCGSGRIVTSRHWTRPVLGRDALAYLVDRAIVYRDLRSGRRRSSARPNHAPAFLAMYGRRLVVYDSVTQYRGPYRIYLGPLQP